MKKIYLTSLLLISLSDFSKADTYTNTVNKEDVTHFSRALQTIKHFYVEPVADKKLFDNAIRGMTSGLDPHSTYLDEDELKDLKSLTKGEFSGIGIEISMEDEIIKVITPLDDSPAQKAGIKAGDYIVRINDEPTRSMKLRDIVKKLRGPKGSIVNLTVIRKTEKKPLQLKVMRDEIHVQSVKSRLLEPGYGYLRISTFQENTAPDAERALRQLQTDSKNQLKGLILDLRNNPGGLLESATTIADDFLTPEHMGKYNDLVVYTKGRMQGSRVQIKAEPGDFIKNAPMIVLVNEGSASGAEIVAGALQDYKRAVILGTRSFGKGSVQTVLPLDNNTALKLTTSLYYTPKGRSIQAEGIEPDVIVEDLRLLAADNGDLDGLNLREADLKNHLLNANRKQILDIVSDTPTAKELATTDYQVFTALNLLKGMVATESTK